MDSENFRIHSYFQELVIRFYLTYNRFSFYKYYFRKGELMVDEKKYAQYVMPAPIKHLGIAGYNWNSVYGHKGEIGADCTLCFHYKIRKIVNW